MSPLAYMKFINRRRHLWRSRRSDEFKAIRYELVAPQGFQKPELKPCSDLVRDKPKTLALGSFKRSNMKHKLHEWKHKLKHSLEDEPVTRLRQSTLESFRWPSTLAYGVKPSRSNSEENGMGSPFSWSTDALLPFDVTGLNLRSSGAPRGSIDRDETPFFDALDDVGPITGSTAAFTIGASRTSYLETSVLARITGLLQLRGDNCTEKWQRVCSALRKYGRLFKIVAWLLLSPLLPKAKGISWRQNAYLQLVAELCGSPQPTDTHGYQLFQPESAQSPAIIDSGLFDNIFCSATSVLSTGFQWLCSPKHSEAENTCVDQDESASLDQASLFGSAEINLFLNNVTPSSLVHQDSLITSIRDVNTSVPEPTQIQSSLNVSSEVILGCSSDCSLVQDSEAESPRHDHESFGYSPNLASSSSASVSDANLYLPSNDLAFVTNLAEDLLFLPEDPEDTFELDVLSNEVQTGPEHGDLLGDNNPLPVASPSPTSLKSSKLHIHQEVQQLPHAPESDHILDDPLLYLSIETNFLRPQENLSHEIPEIRQNDTGTSELESLTALASSVIHTAQIEPLHQFSKSKVDCGDVDIEKQRMQVEESTSMRSSDTFNSVTRLFAFPEHLVSADSENSPQNIPGSFQESEYDQQSPQIEGLRISCDALTVLDSPFNLQSFEDALGIEFPDTPLLPKNDALINARENYGTSLQVFDEDSLKPILASISKAEPAEAACVNGTCASTGSPGKQNEDELRVKSLKTLKDMDYGAFEVASPDSVDLFASGEAESQSPMVPCLADSTEWAQDETLLLDLLNDLETMGTEEKRASMAPTEMPDEKHLECHDFVEQCRRSHTDHTLFWTGFRMLQFEMKQQYYEPLDPRPQNISFNNQVVADDGDKQALHNDFVSLDSDNDFSLRPVKTRRSPSSPSFSGSRNGKHSDSEMEAPRPRPEFEALGDYAREWMELGAMCGIKFKEDHESKTKEVIGRFRRLFLHLIYEIVEKCNGNIEEMLAPLLGIRQELSLVVFAAAGISNEAVTIEEELEALAFKPSKDMWWRILRCKNAIHALQKTHKAALKQLTGVIETTPEDTKKLSKQLATVAEFRDRVMESYYLFIEMNEPFKWASLGEIHTQTRAIEFKNRTLWHAHLNIDRFMDYLQEGVSVLTASVLSVGLMLDELAEKLNWTQLQIEFQQAMAETRLLKPV